MIKKSKTIFIILFVLASVARLVRVFLPSLHHPPAPQHQEQQQHGAHANAALAHESGDVVEVDPGAGGFVLHAQDHDTHVRLSPSTMLHEGLAAIAPEKIEIGDHADVTFAKLAPQEHDGLALDVVLAHNGVKTLPH